MTDVRNLPEKIELERIEYLKIYASLKMLGQIVGENQTFIKEIYEVLDPKVGLQNE